MVKNILFLTAVIILLLSLNVSCTLSGNTDENLSDNANLSSLVISSVILSPAFAADTLNYSDTVDYSVANLTVNPVSASSKADIRVKINSGSYVKVASGAVSGTLALNEGVNTIYVRVTAQNGSTKKTYQIDVSRIKSSNANLSSLSLISSHDGSECLTNFNPDTTSYNLSLSPWNIYSVTMTYTTVYPGMNVDVQPYYPLMYNSFDGTISGIGTLSGSVTLTVTSQDNSNQKVYTITLVAPDTE